MKTLRLETDPYSTRAHADAVTLDRETFYITDMFGTRWQIKQDDEGLVIRTTTGSRMIVRPDCANTIRVAEEN